METRANKNHALDGASSSSSNEVTAKLLEMGFELTAVKVAVNTVGPSLPNAVDYILNNPIPDDSTSNNNNNNKKKERLASKQSTILDHFHSSNKPNRPNPNALLPISSIRDCIASSSPEIGADWEEKAKELLRKHFGFSELKNFQKEALAVWFDNQDCLVLAATGSGNIILHSLCGIPALLTGKVVVVISPLISLMHDQCLKLSNHGVSACFLGSGQPDSSVEQKAMKGLYSVVYVCPETILRLIKPLQVLAESRGIALFAIDEAHCISKWGHDFRPGFRQLSALRKNFSAGNLKFLRADIPIMALTATATMPVREDIIKTLCMSRETKTVLTSFFRPNLRFSLKHSKTSSPSSYGKDFSQLVDIYSTEHKSAGKKETSISKQYDDLSHTSADLSLFDTDSLSPHGLDDMEDDDIDENDNNYNDDEVQGKEMTVDYLENDVDLFQSVDDWDVVCGGFSGEPPSKHLNELDTCGKSEVLDSPNMEEVRQKLLQEPVDQGPTIVYVPTRKETVRIAKYLCGCGVKAAAYNASLPKSHLRQVHKDFHDNNVQVVVATIAFGMGIDKLNVRSIIHYGWPQSLEAYYQEAGRAGRDGKLADCILYANLSRIPTLLPSKRSEEQTKQAKKMLADCFRYGMNTSGCRAKRLVEYFGEDFSLQKCLLCDVCTKGPPEKQNVQEEANILIRVIAAYHSCVANDSCYDDTRHDNKRKRFMEKPNLRTFVSKIREQSQKFVATDQLWWQGLARIMETRRYIREGDDKISVQIKFPEPTELGLEFLQSDQNEPFYIYPEADMLLAARIRESYSTFSDWGKGWADPEIRRQRLSRMDSSKKPYESRKRRNGKSRKKRPNLNTARGRIASKLSKKK
ncbi:hypothetical protein ACFE04_005328 [Oxalis oulophora]